MLLIKIVLNRLLNIKQAIKLIRNDLSMKIYLKKKNENLFSFLQKIKGFYNKNIVIIISFEKPQILDLLLIKAKMHFKDATPIVFDNSNNTTVREEIKQICFKHNILYYSLPKNNIYHANRSHGLAMTWIFYNIIKKIQPSLFAFIDHDLIPFKDIYLSNILKKQSFYGVKNSTTKENNYNLWAGYCVYNLKKINNCNMNYLHDFWRNLDTGGRNWTKIYKYYDQSQINFANNMHINIVDKKNNSCNVNIIDNQWIHIGGISYRSLSKSLIDFYFEMILDTNSLSHKKLLAMTN